MDHIPYPVATSVPPVEVPLLIFHTGSCSDELSAGPSKGEELNENLTVSACTAIQDNLSTGGAPGLDSRLTSEWTLDFWEYPQRQGWTVSGSQPWWTSDGEETARRAQEWMYFGLLQQFLGEPLDVNSLVRRNETSGSILLDSSIIPELLTQWLARQRGSQQEAQNYIDTSCGGSRRESRVLALLTEVALECNKLDNLPAPAQSTALGIRVLVETLENAIYNLAHVKMSATRDVQRLEKNRLLEHRFLTNGWCRFQVARLWGQYSPSTAYYLSSLPRQPTFGGVKHDECDEHRCQTTSIDPTTYKPQHAESCYNDDDLCRMVGVESSKIADCIKRGHIPLVMFQESADGCLQPEIVESREDLRYVALSHVWSGGLGNVNVNSMFSCQVRKIYDLLLELRMTGADEYDRGLGTRKYNDLYRDMRKAFRMPLPEPKLLLWIDTLCVPVGQEHQEVRQSAIAQMAQIYVEAQCVLVVDPELQKMNHADLSDEQIFASILCSSWNSRSWTFQEACMARVFYVQFQDGYCLIDEKWHSFMKRIDETTFSDTENISSGEQAINMHNALMAEVSDWFRTMPVMTKTRGHDTRTLMSRSEDWQNFVRVWNGLRRRSTTKTDDLYGIIAIMVDLSAYEILKLDPSERMKAILRSQSSLPISLLYQDCAKLCDSNGKPLWAPSEIAGDHLKMESEYMAVKDDGLLIDLRDADGLRHSWPGTYTFSSTGLLLTSFTIHVAGIESIISVKLHQTTAVGISEKVSFWVVLCEDKLSSVLPVHNIRGVLMSLRAFDGSTFKVDYVCPLMLYSGSAIAGNAGLECLNEDFRRPAQSLDVENVSLKEYSIHIITDLSSWYKPRVRISKRLLSTPIVIRNIGNIWELGAAILTSNLYLFATIGCAAHHRQPLVRRILYFSVTRYWIIWLEICWVSRVLINWDKERTSRWSTRLYGKATNERLCRIREDVLHPFWTTKFIPLVVGIVSLSVHCTHGATWAKWFGIIAFTEIGLRLVFTCVLTVVLYQLVNCGRYSVTRADVSDMPEDMANYSRTWGETSEERRQRLLGIAASRRNEKCLERGSVNMKHSPESQT